MEPMSQSSGLSQSSGCVRPEQLESTDQGGSTYISVAVEIINRLFLSLFVREAHVVASRVSEPYGLTSGRVWTERKGDDL